MSELSRSVAGVRGIWGESLFPAIATKYATAFGLFVNAGKVILGRDTRTTGEVLKYACISGLLSAGCEIVDIGVCPTPTCQLAVKESEDAAGGIVITASHNPAEWNGLKFLNAEGEFLNERTNEKLFDMIDTDKIIYRLLAESKPFHEKENSNRQAIRNHIDKICNYIDVNLIRRRGFKVVLDACNGAGSRLHLPLLEKLGVTFIKLNCLENGIFPRGPEPMAENLTELSSIVEHENTDIGFAVDPDADRLSIVSEKGEALGEEMTLPLVAQHILEKKGGVVVTNLSTSMAIDFVAQQFNTEVIRTKIGEANVVGAMKQHNCYVGGEGNGGVIIPEIHYARDSGMGIGIILEYLAKSNSPISELANSIPKYFMVKRKLDCPQDKIPSVIAHFKKQFTTEQMDTTDGIKIIWDDSWLHIRKSGTEGSLRIFSEATTSKKANELVAVAIEQIRSLTGLST